MVVQTSTTASTERATDYAVRTIDRRDWPQWDIFVSRSPHGTLFHSTTWLETLEKPFIIIGCFRGDELVGGMPLVIETSERVGCDYLDSPYLGAILAPSSGKRLTALTRCKNIMACLALDVKARFPWVYSQMGPTMTDVMPFIWAGFSTSVVYTHRIHLSDLQQAWGNMEDKRRNDIRKAERDGVTIDTESSVQEVLALVAATFARQGRSVELHRLATRREAVLRKANQCRSFVARNKCGSPLAGIFVVWDDKQAYYLHGGYESTGHRGAGALAIWEAVRFTSQMGLKHFDFLGSHVRPIERFIRDFGGELTPTYAVLWRRPEPPSFCKDIQRAVRRLKGFLHLNPDTDRTGVRTNKS